MKDDSQGQLIHQYRNQYLNIKGCARVRARACNIINMEPCPPSFPREESSHVTAPRRSGRMPVLAGALEAAEKATTANKELDQKTEERGAAEGKDDREVKDMSERLSEGNAKDTASSESSFMSTDNSSTLASNAPSGVGCAFSKDTDDIHGDLNGCESGEHLLDSTGGVMEDAAAGVDGDDGDKTTCDELSSEDEETRFDEEDPAIIVCLSLQMPGVESGRIAPQPVGMLLGDGGSDIRAGESMNSSSLFGRQAKFISALYSSEFAIEEFKGSKPNQLLFRLTLDDTDLERVAARMGLMTRLHKKAGGGVAPFVEDCRVNYEPVRGDGKPCELMMYQKHAVFLRVLDEVCAQSVDCSDDVESLEHLPERSPNPLLNTKRMPRREGGFCSVAVALSDNVISDVIPQHGPKQRRFLLNNWSSAGFDSQPLHDMFDYFGPSLTLTFARIGHLALWMAVPIVLGIAVQVAQIGFLSTDTPMNTPLCLILALWLAAYPVLWNGRDRYLQKTWDYLLPEESEAVRALLYAAAEIRRKNVAWRRWLSCPTWWTRFLTVRCIRLTHVVGYHGVCILGLIVYCGCVALQIYILDFAFLAVYSNRGAAFGMGIIYGVMIVFNDACIGVCRYAVSLFPLCGSKETLSIGTSPVDEILTWCAVLAHVVVRALPVLHVAYGWHRISRGSARFRALYDLTLGIVVVLGIVRSMYGLYESCMLRVKGRRRRKMLKAAAKARGDRDDQDEWIATIGEISLLRFGWEVALREVWLLSFGEIALMACIQPWVLLVNFLSLMFLLKYGSRRLIVHCRRQWTCTDPSSLRVFDNILYLFSILGVVHTGAVGAFVSSSFMTEVLGSDSVSTQLWIYLGIEHLALAGYVGAVWVVNRLVHSEHSVVMRVTSKVNVPVYFHRRSLSARQNRGKVVRARKTDSTQVEVQNRMESYDSPNFGKVGLRDTIEGSYPENFGAAPAQDTV